MIRHHPDQALIFDYASGSLAEASALAVATHLVFCPECRALADDIETMGGALLSDAEPSGLGDDALEAVLARIDAGEPRAGTPPGEETRGRVPSPLWPYVGDGLDHLRWRRRGRAAEEARLIAGRRGPRASLLRVRAGHAVPQHTHRGDEYTVVLVGGYHDGRDQYLRGDFQTATPELHHQPVADPDEDCLCLAVLDAPLRLTGPLGRLLNPFLR